MRYMRESQCVGTRFKFLKFALSLIFSLVLTASCTSKNENADFHTKNEIYPQKIKLTLSEAINYALENNLDARVGALEILSSKNKIKLEQINAFPSVNGSMGARGRSNNGASSSSSILSGSQSLEPSTSTDTLRRFYDLQVNWNTIDLVMAVLQSKTASDQSRIKAYQAQKVSMTIQQDVYRAFIRALFFQNSSSRLQKLEEKVEQYLKAVSAASNQDLISKEQVYQSVSSVSTLLEEVVAEKQNALNAQMELKSLLNLPHTTDVILDARSVPNTKEVLKALDQNIFDLEQRALQQRTEIQEARLNIDIADRESTRAIFQALPGGEFLANFNKDSNSFLEDPRWVSYSASLTQNLMNLISLPLKLRTAKNNKEIEEVRYKALVEAVGFQVRLAYRQIAYAHQLYGLKLQEKTILNKSYKAKEVRFSEGLIAESEMLQGQLQKEVGNIALNRALLNLHNANLQLQMAVGESYGFLSEDNQNDTGGE